jgi:hypothetical protein
VIKFEQEVKHYQLKCTGQIRAGGETLSAEMHKLIKSICSKAELVGQWKDSAIA